MELEVGHLLVLLVVSGVIHGLSGKFIEKHMIFFYPEVGLDAVVEKEIPRLRLVWPIKEVKKAA